MKHPIWVQVLGIVSTIPVLYFWLTMIIPVGWFRQRPGDLSPLLVAMLLAAFTSALAGMKGLKLSYLTLSANIATLAFVALRFH